MPDQSDTDAVTTAVQTHAIIPTTDLFLRAQPAELEGPREVYAALRMLIDFASALFAEGDKLRDNRALRDSVLVALLRRAIVTAESVYVNVAHGLEEPAIVLLRTLLDIEVNIRLVSADTTDNAATKLAAAHYHLNQLIGQDQLADPVTRKGSLEEAHRIKSTIAIARSYAAHLNLPVFDSVRDELRGNAAWHGLSTEAAFRALGAEADYFLLYRPFTLFAHATNVDHDLTQIGDGRLAVRAFVQRDPAKTSVLIGAAAARLIGCLEAYIGEKGLPPTFAKPDEETVAKHAAPDALNIALDPWEAVRVHVADTLQNHIDLTKHEG